MGGWEGQRKITPKSSKKYLQYSNFLSAMPFNMLQDHLHTTFNAHVQYFKMDHHYFEGEGGGKGTDSLALSDT